MPMYKEVRSSDPRHNADTGEASDSSYRSLAVRLGYYRCPACARSLTNARRATVTDVQFI
jgi:hypothetical protein